jgi:hypothetical protein
MDAMYIYGIWVQDVLGRVCDQARPVDEALKQPVQLFWKLHPRLWAGGEIRESTSLSDALPHHAFIVLLC